MQIDTIRLEGPAKPVGRVRVGREHQTTRLAEGTVSTLQRIPLGFGAVLERRHHHDAHQVTALEASLPRQVRDHNIQASPLPEAKDVIHRLYEEAKAYVEWYVPVEQLAVRRLDLVRDFHGVDMLPALAHSWSRIVIPQETSAEGRPRLVVHPALGISTFYRGAPRYRHVAIYDKHSWAHDVAPQHLDQAPQGLVRYEARYRASALRKAGVTGVADLSEPVLERLRRRLWDWYQLGQAVGSLTSLPARLIAADLTPQRKANVLLLAMCRNQGLDSGLPDRSRLRARHDGDELDLDFTDFQGLDRVVRLDYDQGCQVTVAEGPRVPRRHPKDTMWMRPSDVTSRSVVPKTGEETVEGPVGDPQAAS